MIDLVKGDSGSYTCPADPGEPSTGFPRISVTDAEAEQIAKWCTGRRVLEIGTGLGVSTRAIAKVADVVVTVDTDRWVAEHVTPGLSANVEAWDHMPMNTVPMDLAFIDGAHTPEAVERDIRDAARLLVEDGLIVLHDWNHSDVKEGARRAGFREIATIATTHGLAVGRVHA